MPGKPGWSPELEALDQLLGGDLAVCVIRRLFADDSRFERAIEAMLCDGEIQLLTADGDAVPKWQWRDLLNTVALSDTSGPKLSITAKGALRIS
jgi:hypothetical protein